MFECIRLNRFGDKLNGIREDRTFDCFTLDWCFLVRQSFKILIDILLYFKSWSNKNPIKHLKDHTLIAIVHMEGGVWILFTMVMYVILAILFLELNKAVCIAIIIINLKY